MKKACNLSTKYYLSLVVDYTIFIGLSVLMYFYFVEIRILRGIVLDIFLLFILSEDMFFGNHSIGKMILGLRIYPGANSTHLTWTNIVLRRVYEMISPVYFLITKRRFDIDQKTDSFIDENRKRKVGSMPADSQKDIHEISLLEFRRKRMRLLRLKAYIIDFLFISWAWLILLAASLSFPSSIFRHVSEVGRNFLVVGATGIMVMYAILKDFAFGSQSFGKRIVGLKITNMDGSIPTTETIFLRNVFWMFYGIETLVLLVNGRRIGELVSKTTIQECHRK